MVRLVAHSFDCMLGHCSFRTDSVAGQHIGFLVEVDNTLAVAAIDME